MAVPMGVERRGTPAEAYIFYEVSSQYPPPLTFVSIEYLYLLLVYIMFVPNVLYWCSDRGAACVAVCTGYAGRPVDAHSGRQTADAAGVARDEDGYCLVSSDVTVMCCNVL